MAENGQTMAGNGPTMAGNGPTMAGNGQTMAGNGQNDWLDAVKMAKQAGGVGRQDVLW